MAQRFRIFISSPSDVFAERERVERVITRLNGEFGGGLLEAIRWERSYYSAAKTFQDQIALPSQTDLVICILWKRLGFELPPEYVRPDGTTPTGTEYEFEDAMAAARTHGTPDVLVYRKAAPVLLDAEQVELERAQFEALKTFWSRWFRNESGHFTAAYQSFETTDQFETQVEDHLRQWLGRHEIASAGVTWSIGQRGSPFRGLQAFDAGHADVFFGRRRAVERARERLADAARRGTAFLLVLGTSGSGKSSLARAGLLPRLTQPGAVPGVDVWRCCVMRPTEGDSAAHALARALYRTDAIPELAQGDNPTPADFARLLGSAPDAAARAVRLALGRGTAGIAAREGFDRKVEARLLLVVDQFEEALASSDAGESFAQSLAALVSSGVTWVVATLRSDLYAPFQANATLMGLREGGAQFDLVPPTAAELGEIVTGPAAAAGLRFDIRADGTGLDEVLTGAADQPGALPLLQLALDALFEARDPQGLLTFAAFDALGGLSGVVERRAEQALAGLDPEAASALPTVLRALVEVTDDGVVTSRAAPLPHSTAAAGSQPAVLRLVNGFVAARLLMLDTQAGEPRMRVAHDALLSGWPRAAALIERDREMLRTRGRVEAAARRWLAEARNADFLLPPGRPLAEAVELATHEPDSLDRESAAFIEASQAADVARTAMAAALAERELRLAAEAQAARADAAVRVVRRTRLAAAVVSVLLVVAAGAAVFANQQRAEARRQALRAEQQTAEAEAQTARAQRNFQAALDSGASLVAAVNAHLSDGGMTRGVARALLETAKTGMGSLLPQNAEAALPAALLDTQSHLEISFSRVLAAVCSSGEARMRAAQALATAEAAARQAPSDERERAVVAAMHAIGVAAEAEADWEGAQAIFEQAERRAMMHEGETWKDLLQTIRQDLAFTLSDGPQRARAVVLLEEDLVWEETRARLNPNDLSILARSAKDERTLGYSARVARDYPEALAHMEREAALLHRLAGSEPTNLQWQRYLSNNALQRSLVRKRQGDAVGSLALVREAAEGAAALQAHDPANALWLIGKLSTDLNLAVALREGGDVAGARAVLRPDLAAAKALGAGEGSNRMCRSEAAVLQSGIGNAMVLLGNSEEGVAALEATVALARTLAADAPGDAKLQRGVVDAELSLARAMVVAEQAQGAAAHARAGIAAMQALMARGPALPEMQVDLSRLRGYLGDALIKTGDTEGALAVFEADRAAGAALSAAEPGEGAWRNQIAASLLRTSTLHGVKGQPAAQWTALQDAAAAVAPWLGRTDLPLAWQRTLIEVRQFMGTAEFVRGDHAAGLARYREALALAEAAAARFPDDIAARSAPIYALVYLAAALRQDGQIEAARAADERRATLASP